MKLSIEAVTNVEQEAAAARVRREVFGTEWGFELCRNTPNSSAHANQLIARLLPEGDVVATVTVLETTRNRILQEKYELPSLRYGRIARYTQMAVLKPYRGLNLPLYMLLEARRLFVSPDGFAYTWLLFPADRAMSSRFCTMLDFSVGSHIVDGEQGPSRVLLRDEKAAEADIADMQTRAFLEEVRPKGFQVIAPVEPCRAYSGLVREDEWIAH
jgi:hypothetical protein